MLGLISLYRMEVLMKAHKEFMYQIADGKLLMRFSYMTHNVTCDCCHSEEKIEVHEQEDKLAHKPWCIVTAARTYFPDFIPSRYPDKLQELRGWGIERCDRPLFAWRTGGKL